MRVLERRRSENAVRFAVALLAAATIACSGASGSSLEDPTRFPAATADATGHSGGLVELQRALPAGNEAVWYTQRLAALGYEIVKLRQERGGLGFFRVARAGDDYEVRVVMDDDGRVARSVEIQPTSVTAGVIGGEVGGEIADGTAAEAPPAPGDTVDAARRGDEGGFGSPQVGAVRQGVVPERESRAIAQPAVASQPLSSVEPVPQAESEVTRPRDPIAEPQIPEPGAASIEPPGAPPAPVPASGSGARAAAPPLPEPRSYTVRVPAGTLVAARLDSGLSSKNAQVGDGFTMHVSEPVRVDGIEVLPAGTQVWGYVAEVERAGRPNKGGRLVLATDSVRVAGEELALDAIVGVDGRRLQGRGSAREDIAEVAVGSGLGGLVGGLLGGKKGVLVGALAGGGGTYVATKGEEVEIPTDAPLSLELRRDLSVTFVDSE